MTKKETATLNSQVQEQTATSSSLEPPMASTDSATAPTNKAKAGGPPSGFYIYIGPNIKGLIRNNTIYRGNRENALVAAREAITRYPLVKTLIIPGDYLPTARLKVKTAGNALHGNYVKLADQVKSEAAKK